MRTISPNILPTECFCVSRGAHIEHEIFALKHLNGLVFIIRIECVLFEVWTSILDVFAKLRKTSISFVMSSRPSGTTRLALQGFSLNSTVSYFSKICRENSGFIKIQQERRVIYVKTDVHFDHISLSSS
jgi:hypothetical protein